VLLTLTLSQGYVDAMVAAEADARDVVSKNMRRVAERLSRLEAVLQEQVATAEASRRRCVRVHLCRLRGVVLQCWMSLSICCILVCVCVCLCVYVCVCVSKFASARDSVQHEVHGCLFLIVLMRAPRLRLAGSPPGLRTCRSACA
jgi:hypothetical protein